MKVAEKVREILLEILDILEADLNFDKKIRADFGASSVQVVEIVAAVENEFDMDIPEEDLSNLLTPSDIVRYIEERAGN